MTDVPRPHGPIPDHLCPRTRKIVLEDFSLPVDIGFHDFEVGRPQRLFLTVEVWVDEASFPEGDDASTAWNYDFLRTEIAALATARRYNLQESLVRAIYDLVAVRPGVTALSVRSRKPDIYPDCAGVGVDLASF
jgi:dihydroneopterin aldolase